MAAIELKKGTQACDIHNEYYSIHKRFGDPEESNNYWNELDGELSGWTNKYKGTDYEEMVRMMAVGILGMLDSRLRRKKNDTHTL